MVFMLAIVFAFATEKTTTNDESLLVTGYIMQDGFCVISTTECSIDAAYPCNDSFGRRVHLQKLGDTVCSQPLFDWTP